MKLNCVLLFVLSVLTPHTIGCSTIQGVFNFHTIDEPNQYYYLKQSCVQIVGLTQTNLERFTYPIDFIEVSKFTFDNLSTLNQPDLFAGHKHLKLISFETYFDPEQIVLHEDLFTGLDNLIEVALVGLNLDKIPLKLFSRAPLLEIVNISHNKLRSLEPDTFVNNSNLFLIYLTGNQLLQSNQPLALTLARNETTLYLSESYVSNFNSLVPLFSNYNISNIRLESTNFKSVKLNDFAQFPMRKTLLKVWIHDTDYAFNIADLRDNQINTKILNKEIFNKTVLQAYIYTTVSLDSNLCRDCEFLKESFKSYLRNGRFYIFLVDQNVAFELILDCKAIENRYTSIFTSYCPAECECRYNPFLDKIWFDCHHKNLTSVPEIRYPEQLTKINSISIDLSRNNLETVNLSTIQRSVIELITEINLNDNQIKFINFGYTVLLKLHQIQLCQNPIWNLFDNITMYVGKTWRVINDEKCIVGVPLPVNPLKYMSSKSEADIDTILESGQCIV